MDYAGRKTAQSSPIPTTTESPEWTDNAAEFADQAELAEVWTVGDFCAGVS